VAEVKVKALVQRKCARHGVKRDIDLSSWIGFRDIVVHQPSTNFLDITDTDSTSGRRTKGVNAIKAQID